MKHCRSFFASLALIALMPWQAALAIPDVPEVPNCDFNGNVHAIEVMPDGTTYVGGNFLGVTCDGGMTNYTPSYVAKILPNGQFDASWDNKGVNGPVWALETDGTRLYVGGSFTEAIGNPVNYGYNNIAALELATGYADTSFMEENIGAGTNGPVYSIINNTYEGAGIIIGGDFDTVSDSFVSLGHSGIGFLASDGLVEQSFGRLSLINGGGYANALALVGSRLYIGGSFDTVTWDAGSETRRNIVAVDLALDAAADSAFVIASFDPDLDAEVRAMAIDASHGRVFLGGDFTQAKISTAPVNAFYLQPFSLTDGQPELIFGVYPSASVLDLDLEDGELFVAGNFVDIFGTGRNFVGSLDVSAVAVTLTPWNPNPDNDVYTVDVAGNHGAIGGNFSNVAGSPASFFARFKAPTFSHSISGTVFEDINFGLNFGRDKAAAYANGGMPVFGATVEFYNANTLNYLGSVTTNPVGDYTWAAPSAGDYIVRVVDETVLSNRLQSFPSPHPMAVSTFVTDAGIGVTNRVGGAFPELADHPVNNGSQMFSDLSPGGMAPQTFGTISVTGDVTGVDFGYNFNLVVNTNDSGRGSLRSAIANANTFSNTGLAQNGFAAGTENIIFRIPNGTAALGMDPALNFFDPVQQAAVISLASSLPDINESLRLDGTSQPSSPSNTSTPIVLNANFNTYGMRFFAPENQVRGFSLVNVAYANLSFADGTNEITGNKIGVFPDNTITTFSSYGIFFENDAAGATNTIGSAGEPNVFTGALSASVFFNGNADGSVIQSNYFGLYPDGQAVGYCYDGIVFNAGGTDVQIGGLNNGEGNVFAQCNGTGIRQWLSGVFMDRLKIIGNYFGTDVTGMVALSMTTPIFLSRSVDLQLGGANVSESNLFVAANNPVTIDQATGTRILGNVFGLYADGVSPAALWGDRSIMFTGSTTDTQIGDGTTNGANVFAQGMSKVDFIDYGTIIHRDVRVLGNKLGVDRTGTVFFPVSNGFQLNGIEGLTVGGTTTGEGNHAMINGGMAFSMTRVQGLGFYGNICNANNDISASPSGLDSDCASLYEVTNAQIGAPGNGRNYFGANNNNLNIGNSQQVVVQNNYFNINATGSAPLHQTALRGLSINSSTNTLVGGINPGEGNLFGSYKGSLVAGDLGMAIDSQGNNGLWIQGNIIGSDITGTYPYEGDFGIGVAGYSEPAQNIVIGGNTSAHGNLIFGAKGILLYGSGVTNVLIEGNAIGVNRNGDATSSGAVITPLPFGVLKPTGISIIWGANNNTIKNNIIGGVPSNSGGVGPGIYIANDQNSPFGVVSPPLQNRISQNSFKENAGSSIDIEETANAAGGDGVTPNDGILDMTRAQYGLDYPIITSSTLVGGTLYVEGHVGSGLGISAFADVEVEIYEQDDDGNQNGEINAGDGLSVAHGEGLTYLGTVMTDSVGGNFIGSVPAPFLASSTKITALAIDSLNNTSEFGVYYDGVVTAPPTSTPPTSTPPAMVAVSGLGGLACHNAQGNFCDNNVFKGIQTAPVTEILIPQVPLVPMPWLNEVATTPPVACTPLITKYLKKGNNNDAGQVKLLQQFLKEKDGSYSGPINGLFDQATDVAVRAFQKKYAKEVLGPWGHNIPTGYVYITTSRKINALHCQR